MRWLYTGSCGPYFPYNLSAPVVAGAMVSYSSHKLGIVSLILSSISIITGSIQMAVGPYFPYNLGAPVVAGAMISYRLLTLLTLRPDIWTKF